jgi:hypothetical protein
MRVDDDHGFLAMYPPLQTVENGQLPIPVHFLDYLGVFENMANLNGHSNRENDGSETSPLHEISRRWTPLALKEPKSQIKISSQSCVYKKKMVCETSKKGLDLGIIPDGPNVSTTRPTTGSRQVASEAHRAPARPDLL